MPARVRRNSASSRRFLASAARVRFARTRSSFFFFLASRSETRRAASRAASPAKAQSLRCALSSRRRRAAETGRAGTPLPPYAASTRASRARGGNFACARRPDEAAPDAGGDALPQANRSRRAASAYARSTRAVSAATSASRSVPSSPTRAVACPRSRRSTAATRPCAPASASTATRRFSAEPPI